jgi:hypothetical protein
VRIIQRYRHHFTNSFMARRAGNGYPGSKTDREPPEHFRRPSVRDGPLRSREIASTTAAINPGSDFRRTDLLNGFCQLVAPNEREASRMSGRQGIEYLSI